jgi:tetraacyldisaccharide 4'-kinase
LIAPKFWRGERPGWTARALSPIGAIYGAVTARRMARPVERVSVPVVCVGNFVAGGAGKTPTAIAVAKLLRGAGERVAFLSRGYRGEARGEALRVDPLTHGARAVGDEPLLLARIAPCFVGRDRVASARAAIEAGASVLVMDDGMQNPSLAKDLTIAVVDGETWFGNGLCLPAGPLRAPLSIQLRFVDAMVVVGGPPGAIDALPDTTPDKPIFRARLRADALAAAALVGRPVLGFAGIARPEKFFATLAEIGANVVQTRGFPDHHPYGSREIDRLRAEAGARGLVLVTTEKDHVRIPVAEASDILPLPVTLGFDDPRAVGRWLTGRWR